MQTKIILWKSNNSGRNNYNNNNNDDDGRQQQHAEWGWRTREARPRWRHWCRGNLQLLRPTQFICYVAVDRCPCRRRRRVQAPGVYTTRAVYVITQQNESTIIPPPPRSRLQHRTAAAAAWIATLITVALL